MRRGRVFYGWIIVAAGMAVMATSTGIVNNCFGLFIVPACRDMGFTRQQMGITQTMLALGSMIVALLSGAIIPKVKLKRLMCLGAIIMCLTYALFSLAKSLLAFYSIALVVGITQAATNVVPFSIIIGNWFHEKRGLALGLTFMGSGVGGMLFNALGGQLIPAIGWRATFVVYAGLLLVTILPLVFFVVKIKPGDMGLEPLGEYSGSPSENENAGLSVKQSLKTVKFYVLALDIAVAGLAVNAVATTATPYYTDVFSSETVGANLAAGFMACLAFGKFALGDLNDRLGVRRATLLARVLLIITLFSLSRGGSTPFIVLYLISCGFACASSSVSIPMIALNAFGPKDSAALTGIFSAAQSFGGLFAPAVCGMVCDVTGSYAPSYVVLLIAVGVMIAPMLWANRVSR